MSGTENESQATMTEVQTISQELQLFGESLNFHCRIEKHKGAGQEERKA
jgi:hypothetical protein